MPRPKRNDQLNLSEDLLCDDRIVHVDAVRAARSSLPGFETIDALSGLFAALGDVTRLRMVAALSHSELCVCDLAATVGITESAVSHQLRALRTLGVVRSRREGRLVYYSLDDEHVSAIFSQGLIHAAHRNEEQGA